MTSKRSINPLLCQSRCASAGNKTCVSLQQNYDYLVLFLVLNCEKIPGKADKMMSRASETAVTLDDYISDLNLEICADRYSCQPLHKDGFAYMWAGAKATSGVRYNWSIIYIYVYFCDEKLQKKEWECYKDTFWFVNIRLLWSCIKYSVLTWCWRILHNQQNATLGKRALCVEVVHPDIKEIVTKTEVKEGSGLVSRYNLSRNILNCVA